ncbi:MAG TPA: Fur family transcriptional regulator [Magnetospirillaceae bacterium]
MLEDDFLGPSTALSQQPMRNTRGRRAILAALGEDAHHPDAETLHQFAQVRDPGLSLASVYRTLRELETRGLVMRHSFFPGAARWELTGGAPHDHFVDLQTGLIIDFHSDEVRAVEEAVATRLGYRLAHARLALYGTK